MGKKTKNPAQKLSYGDKEILERVAFLCAAVFYSLTQQYPNARKFVEKVILTKTVDEKIAIVSTILYARNASSNYSFTPKELNQRLANDLSTIQQNFKDMLVQQSDGDPKRFLNPRDLREKVLTKLENRGILLHLQGKEKIKNYKREKRRPGRPSLKLSIEDKTDRGGLPSIYITTEEFEKLKKILNKSDALDFLCDKIIGS